ncbi:MAG: methyltransferase domain-containing protein [bacterium]
MATHSMNPYGLALLDYFHGDVAACLDVLRDDGLEFKLPVSTFFKDPEQFTLIEKTALALCSGNVLDIGAGAGSHSLYLQHAGVNLRALEISPEAVEVMKQRGVFNVECGDIFEFGGKSFDTLLLLPHGIGLVGSIDGLQRFLHHALHLTNEQGIILFDSLDVRCTDDPVHLAYHRRNMAMNRYFGEIMMSFAYKGIQGEQFSWLQIDPETLEHHSNKLGWHCEILHQEAWGDYLVKLTKF